MVFRSAINNHKTMPPVIATSATLKVGQKLVYNISTTEPASIRSIMFAMAPPAISAPGKRGTEPIAEPCSKKMAKALVSRMMSNGGAPMRKLKATPEL